MLSRNIVTRGAIASTALAGALALGLPGLASAEESYPAPAITATMDGKVVTTTVTDNADPQKYVCGTVLMPAATALQVVANPALPPLEIAKLEGVQVGEESTRLADGRTATNTFTVEPGVYAVVGSCLDKTDTQVKSTSIALVFTLDGVGSVSQGLDFGSLLDR